ncbi:hypothetical protein L226DRAFT_537114 [Lentinus tigrinus ALCF2SS1-7]|uniref:uncharacterized protein n=1 Tax=Lentinus tigrinus ALCF2SS1-7 TaxID=1328758 RepID=UPI0011662B81|nr:hypothetical protein L226DRAFT_537114 [Lentinus tigrinus ALCF2SS1-7]
MRCAHLSISAAFLLTGCGLVSAAHLHRYPAAIEASEHVAAPDGITAISVHARGTEKERRESGGNLINSIEYCTDPNFKGQCAMPTVTLEDCMIITDPVFMNTTSSFRTNDDCVYCELYRDSFCITDIATIYAGTAVGDGGESSKGANFNDKVLSFRCRRGTREWMAPNCPS